MLKMKIVNEDEFGGKCHQLRDDESGSHGMWG